MISDKCLIYLGFFVYFQIMNVSFLAVVVEGKSERTYPKKILVIDIDTNFTQ